MPQYIYNCKKCGNNEIHFQQDFKQRRRKCSNCGILLKKVIAPIGDTELDYRQPVLSDAMGVDESQVTEHRRIFPDVPITDDGRVICRSHSERKRIMKRLGFHDKDGYY